MFGNESIANSRLLRDERFSLLAEGDKGSPARTSMLPALRRLGMAELINGRVGSFLAGTMGTAVKGAVSLNAVAQNLTATVIADRRELVDGTFKAIEDVGHTRGDNLKGQVVIVAAHFTGCHNRLLPESLTVLTLLYHVCPSGVPRTGNNGGKCKGKVVSSGGCSALVVWGGEARHDVLMQRDGRDTQGGYR